MQPAVVFTTPRPSIASWAAVRLPKPGEPPLPTLEKPAVVYLQEYMAQRGALVFIRSSTKYRIYMTCDRGRLAAEGGKRQPAVCDVVPRPNRKQTRQVDGDRCQCKFALKLGKDGRWHLSDSACVWTHNHPPHAPEVALHAQRRTLLSAEVLEKIQLSAQRGQKPKAIFTYLKFEHPDLRLELTDVKNICTDFLRAGQLDAQQAIDLLQAERGKDATFYLATECAPQISLPTGQAQDHVVPLRVSVRVGSRATGCRRGVGRHRRTRAGTHQDT